MNKILLIITVLIAIATSSCKKKENIPDHIIQPELYQQILRDVFLAEANHKLAMRNHVSTDYFLDSSYQHIYIQYNVKAEDVDSSYKFYIKHPQIFKNITEKVLDELHQLEQKDSVNKNQ